MRWIGTFSILLLMANVASSYEIASTVREPIPSQVPYYCPLPIQCLGMQDNPFPYSLGP